LNSDSAQVVSMSTILKSNDCGRLLREPVAFDLADYLAEARGIVAAAHEQARRILEQARREGARLREETRRSGEREGRERGLAEGRSSGHNEALAAATERFTREQADLVAAVTAALESLESQKQDLLIAARHDVLEFAVAVARRITGCIARLDHQAAVHSVEQALWLVGTKTDVTIRVNPQDAEALRKFAGEWSHRLAAPSADQREGGQTSAAASHVRLVEDESVSPGGAVVATERTEIDTRIETQLDQIAALVLGEKPSANGE